MSDVGNKMPKYKPYIGKRLSLSQEGQHDA